MVRPKSVIVIAMIMLFSLFAYGCRSSHETYIVYDNFQGNFTTDRFDVFCDWDSINSVLEEHEYEKNGMYSSDVFSFEESEEYSNSIGLYNYLQTDEDFNNTTPGAVDVSYGAILYNSVSNRNHAGDKYFNVPMIQIHLYNIAENNGDVYQDYLAGYRAVYSLDGELALEEGQWFLDVDKDEFCQHYFEIMLKAIGKSC